jgi:hypothetical protein
MAVLLGLAIAVGVVAAATHFLVSWSFSYAEGASSEFSVTQAYFTNVQSTRKDAGTWFRGDKFAVEYKDGVVAEFVLSSRGMVCTGFSLLGPRPPCKWAGTVPFDSVPTIVQQSRSGLPIVNTNLGIDAVGKPVPLPMSYPVPLPFRSAWEVWTGPLVRVAAPPVPGCTRNPCPMLN